MHILSQVTTLLTLTSLTNAAAVCKRQEGTSISLIGSARRSAFFAASSAFVAATPQPNSIICPGVIGAASTAAEPPGDEVRLRIDPSAISALEQRQSIRPQESRDGNRRSRRLSRLQTATPVVDGVVDGVAEEPQVTGVVGPREPQGLPMDPPHDVEDPVMHALPPVMATTVATPTSKDVPSGTSY